MIYYLLSKQIKKKDEKEKKTDEKIIINDNSFSKQ